MAKIRTTMIGGRYMKYEETELALEELIPSPKIFLKSYDISSQDLFNEICMDVDALWWAQNQNKGFLPLNILALEDFVSMIL